MIFIDFLFFQIEHILSTTIYRLPDIYQSWARCWWVNAKGDANWLSQCWRGRGQIRGCSGTDVCVTAEVRQCHECSWGHSLSLSSVGGCLLEEGRFWWRNKEWTGEFTGAREEQLKVQGWESVGRRAREKGNCCFLRISEQFNMTRTQECELRMWKDVAWRDR